MRAGDANSASVAIELSDWAAQGDWRLIFLHRDRLEQGDAGDVQRSAKKYLQRNNRTVGMFIPTQQGRSGSPSRRRPNLAAMIGDYKGRERSGAGEAFDSSPANIEARTQRLDAASGLKTALLPKKTRGEAVQLRLTLRYGNSRILKGKDDRRRGCCRT